MNVEIIAHTDMNAEKLCGTAAATCYRSKDPEKALRNSGLSGHESVLEHAVYTFRIDGISRVTLSQLTRHRIASFSVESQRYTDQGETQVIIPQSIRENTAAMALYTNAVTSARWAYKALVQEGIPKEDARYLLPEGMETRLILTMNARELRHFFTLRCCNRAQLEIRELAERMLDACVKISPILFSDAGPGCVRGKCTEEKPCGHPRSENR